MKQMSFCDVERANKPVRADVFLAEMNQIMPWEQLFNLISPFYGTVKTGGRDRYPIETMMRIYFLQQWYNLSDPAAEEAVHDRKSFRTFLKMADFEDKVPDETSIMRFRHLMEKHNLGPQILAATNAFLAEHGCLMQRGTLVDATIIHAPKSTKNREKQRDPEMSSTHKNGTWHHGMKMHIGTQAEGKPLVHHVVATTAKVHDRKAMPQLLRGDEAAVFGDSAYGQKDEKKMARKTGVFYGVQDKGVRKHALSSKQKRRNALLSRVRKKIEHVFGIIKNQWGHGKTRYRGLAKNAHQFSVLCALANVYLVRKQLLAA